MKSVLEALGGKVQPAAVSPPPSQNAASPTSSESVRVSHVYNNVPVSETNTYESIPAVVGMSANGTSSSPESNPRASHYDVPRISTTQQPLMVTQPGVHEITGPKPKPTASPRQSPAQNRASHYSVPRPISSATVESVYDVPRAANNQPLSPPASTSHYDIPRITTQLPASKSHYDVPRQPAAEPLQSPGHLQRTSSDTDLNKDTIKVPAVLPKQYTPPVTPRRLNNNRAKTLDSKSYKDMQEYNADAKKKEPKKKPLFKRRQT